MNFLKPPGPVAKRVAPWITMLVLALGWHLGATASSGLLIPGFTDTVIAFVQLFGRSEVWAALFVSNQALLLGFLLSIVMGVPTGLLIGRFKVLRQLVNPYIDILLVLPMAAVIPLVVMTTGIGIWSRVVLIFLFAVPMLIVNTLVGVTQVKPERIEMARSFGANECQTWIHVLFRSAAPEIMTGVRIGLGRAINGMIIGELLMVAVGLGGLILSARASFNPSLLYAIVLLTLVESALLMKLVRVLERRLIPWARVS